MHGEMFENFVGDYVQDFFSVRVEEVETVVVAEIGPVGDNDVEWLGCPVADFDWLFERDARLEISVVIGNLKGSGTSRCVRVEPVHGIWPVTLEYFCEV